MSPAMDEYFSFTVHVVVSLDGEDNRCIHLRWRRQQVYPP